MHHHVTAGAAAKFVVLVLFLLLSLSSSPALSYKIVFLLPIAGPSQLNVVQPLADELARRRHTVTVVTCVDPPNKFDPAVRILRTSSTLFDPQTMKEYIDMAVRSGPMEQMRANEPLAEQGCDAFLSDQLVVDLIREGVAFDLALVDTLFGECATAVTPLISRNTAYLSTMGLAAWKWTSVPRPPSVVPSLYDRLPSRMDFWQRMQNTITSVGVRWFFDLRMLPAMQRVVTHRVPGAPSLDEAERHATFTLTNADPVLYSPRPTMPDVVDVGGMHCRKAKPLPKDLDEFVESSGDAGFIVFGLGSNARSSFLDETTQRALLSAFSRLKQKVIWKFEEPLDNLPPNVKLTKWLPQQDLLGHPKIRLFITHAGLLSLQEAVYHGVPVIGFPLFADQPANVARVVELEIGGRLDVLNITEEGVFSLVSRIVNDHSYSSNMKRYSSIFRDQPESPLERAVFWTEYVIRHDGALHLRSQAHDLSLIQYYLVDVIAFALVSVLFLVLVSAFLVRLAVRSVWRSGERKKAASSVMSSRKKNK